MNVQQRNQMRVWITRLSSTLVSLLTTESTRQNGIVNGVALAADYLACLLRIGNAG